MVKKNSFKKRDKAFLAVGAVIERVGRCLAPIHSVVVPNARRLARASLCRCESVSINTRST